MSSRAIRFHHRTLGRRILNLHLGTLVVVLVH